MAPEENEGSKEAIKSMKKPTDKQQRFVDSYDGDIRRSAKAAGLSYGYCKQLMCLPKHAHIQKLIANRKITTSNQLIKTREQRKEFWSKLMDKAKKDSDKLKASELLGRSEADFIDTVRAGIGGLTDLSNLTGEELDKHEKELGGNK